MYIDLLASIRWSGILIPILLYAKTVELQYTQGTKDIKYDHMITNTHTDDII